MSSPSKSSLTSSDLCVLLFSYVGEKGPGVHPHIYTLYIPWVNFFIWRRGACPPTPPLLPFFRARVSAKNVALIFATPTAAFPSAFIAFFFFGRVEGGDGQFPEGTVPPNSTGAETSLTQIDFYFCHFHKLLVCRYIA